tara:strand:+ start:264 stop:431 length:168 start_codon:yes stop_codon:yes gene_type:complete
MKLIIFSLYLIVSIFKILDKELFSSLKFSLLETVNTEKINIKIKIIGIIIIIDNF